jgi:hypothetical protein
MPEKASHGKQFFQGAEGNPEGNELTCCARLFPLNSETLKYIVTALDDT